MDLASQIYIRKSCRNYSDDEIDMAPIHEFISNAMPLDDSICYRYKIFTREEVNIRTRWSAPYYLALFSEKKENYQDYPQRTITSNAYYGGYSDHFPVYITLKK